MQQEPLCEVLAAFFRAARNARTAFDATVSETCGVLPDQGHLKF